jgi:predicted nucleic acid-binding protein
LKVVSNSSVLISLSIIGQLDLLHKRFPDGILIPAAVWHEVVESAQGRAGAKQVAAVRWIEVMSIADTDLVTMLKTSLDTGEAEATVLCAAPRRGNPRLKILSRSTEPTRGPSASRAKDIFYA